MWFYINGSIYFAVPITVVGGQNITGGTKTTADQPILNLTDTWNNVAVTFAGIKYVIVDTNSAAGSLPFQILGGAAGATNLVSVSKAGAVTIPSTLSAGNATVAAGGLFYWDGRSVLRSGSDGQIAASNLANTGFTTLSLGPVTSNTASGALSISNAVATINMATASGTGTGTITVANFIPADAIVLSFSARVTTILAGASLTTWSVGPSTDLDMWGTGLALAAGTLVNASNYTITSGGGVINSGAATNLVITAAAGVLSTGVVKVTLHYLLATPFAS